MGHNMIDRDDHEADQRAELIVESLASGTVLRSPASSDEWLLARDDDVVDVAEKK